MRRKKVEDSQSEPIDDSMMVFAGSVRAPGDEKGLSVDISKSGGDIVMASDKAELGRWPVADVTIRPLNATLFAFDAEGDHLLFTPTDPALFGVSPLVTVEVVEGRRRGRRKRNKRSAVAAPSIVVDEEPIQKDQRTGTTDSLFEPVDPEPVDPEPVESGYEHEGPQKAFRTRPWLLLVDVGRRNRLFGLDRVPIDEALRGRVHEHTWNHRVATRSGLASHVCTVCGKIRFWRRPVARGGA